MPTNSQSLRRNKLLRVAKLQKLFKEQWREGESKKRFWAKHIENVFGLQYHTFINYLGVNVERESAELEAQILATEKEKVGKVRNRVDRLKSCVRELYPHEAAALVEFIGRRFPDLMTSTPSPGSPVAPKRKKPQPQTSDRGE